MRNAVRNKSLSEELTLSTRWFDLSSLTKWITSNHWCKMSLKAETSWIFGFDHHLLTCRLHEHETKVVQDYFDNPHYFSFDEIKDKHLNESIHHLSF